MIVHEHDPSARLRRGPRRGEPRHTAAHDEEIAGCVRLRRAEAFDLGRVQPAETPIRRIDGSNRCQSGQMNVL
jgi:hypothetical protein